MSGGSFNYLCHKDMVQMLGSGMSDLDSMAAELEAIGYVAREPAEATRALQARLRVVQEEIDAELDRLQPIFHAVEWWRSCDWGKDQVLVTIGKWLAAQEGGREDG